MSQEFRNSGVARCISATDDGRFIIAGLQYNFSKGDEDVILMKLDVDPFTRIPALKSGKLHSYGLNQNYPNPFNPSTTIEFLLPKTEFVELKVYNILGKQISTLVSKKLNQGNHKYIFDGKNLASGIYYYQLVAGDFRKVKKMILIK